MPIIDLAEAKEHLRVDHDDEDADIAQKLEEASIIVVDYLKLPHGTWDIGNASQGSGTNPDMAPGQVKAAVKLVLGTLYRNREGDVDPITPAVQSLLMRSRDPALR